MARGQTWRSYIAQRTDSTSPTTPTTPTTPALERRVADESANDDEPSSPTAKAIATDEYESSGLHLHVSRTTKTTEQEASNLPVLVIATGGVEDGVPLMATPTTEASSTTADVDGYATYAMPTSPTSPVPSLSAPDPDSMWAANNVPDETDVSTSCPRVRGGRRGVRDQTRG